MIDFSDKMEKSNFSYISKMISKKGITEEEKVFLLTNVIEVHKKYSDFKSEQISKLGCF